MAKRFEGKNIVFVNVALDDAELPWSQLVKVKKLPGVHMRLVGGYQSATARAYGLQEVPTYLLIGEDGTILNPKPKRMSSRAAVDEINQSFGKASTYTAAITQLPTSTGGK